MYSNVDILYYNNKNDIQNNINNNFILLLILSFLTLSYYISTDSTTDSQWVSQQTSIIADNNINIRTKNNTNLIGSVVASNSDNLSLNTRSLTYSDLNDFYREETKGYNFGTSVGGNTDKGKANMAPNGSTTIGMTHTGQEKEQITRATIGNGSIVIANNKDISDLNRNVDKSQEITKDIITGALNASVTIDNRLFTSNGRKDVVNDFKNLGSNLVTLYKDITKNNIIVQSVKNAVTNKDKNIVDAVKDYVRDSKQIDQIRDNKEITDNLNGMTNLDAERVRNTMQSVVDVASQDGGFNGNVNIYEEYGSGDGYSYSDKNDPNNNTIGVNVRNTDIADSNKVINVLFHETTNQEQHDKNERTALNRGNTAEAIWDMKNYANTNTNKMTGSQWLNNNINSPVIKQGNDNYLANAMRYVYDNKDGSKAFNQKNQKDFVFNVSPQGKEFIKAEEGKVFGASSINDDGTINNSHLVYKDGVGLQTIGYGHLLVGDEKSDYANGIDEDKAKELFDGDVKKVEDLMALTLSRQPEQQEVDAMASSIFNLGPKFFIKDYEETKDGTYDYSQISKGTTNTFKKLNSDNNTLTDEEITKVFTNWKNCKNCTEKEKEAIYNRRVRESNVYNSDGNSEVYLLDREIKNDYKKAKLVNPDQRVIRSILIKQGVIK